MKARLYAAGLMAAVIAMPSLATELTTFDQKISYSVGYKVGRSLKAGQGELNLDLDIVKEFLSFRIDIPDSLTKKV